MQFSSLARLLRVTVFVLKAVRLLLWRRLSPELQTSFSARRPFLAQLFERTTSSPQPASSDFNVARLFWEHNTQRRPFADVHRDVLQRHVTNGLQKQLGLKSDEDGLLRCHGRLVHANLPLDAKHPILLPRTPHFTRLVIRDTHDKLFHGGVSHTLANVRLRYWIPQGRAAVRQVLRSCPLCKRYDGRPFSEIGAMLLFFLQLKSAILCDLYLLTYIICAIETPCDANLFSPFVSIHFFNSRCYF